MRPFSERNQLVLGGIGIALVAAIILGALNYDKIPFLTGGRDYSAYFAEASGITSGAEVQVSGFRVGNVDSVTLDGPQVLVTFTIDKSVRLGDRTEAAIKTKSLLGSKILEVTPRGENTLDGPIPVERTTPAYQLPDALGDLTETISGLNTGTLNEALTTLSTTFQDTPDELRGALDGVARFSATINERDEQLRNLLANANEVTGVLSERTDQVVSLIADSNALLLALQSQSGALDAISDNIAAVSQQLSGFVTEQEAEFKTTLDQLNVVLEILDNRKARLQESIKRLNTYAMSLGESVASGPFFKAYLANLLPGQFVQPFIDAAFSDLGLDPNVLLPSELTDPQVGQPGTPALPVPFPRTGQGGDPNLTLQDAITGNPGDPQYPYVVPEPQPEPGGPPPGPPLGYEPTPLPTAPVVSGPAAPGPGDVTVVPLPETPAQEPAP